MSTLLVGETTEITRTDPETLFNGHIQHAEEVARKLLFKLPAHTVNAIGDDLIMIALCALWQTAQSFDGSTGAIFWGYASKRVRGAMLDELRRADHIPRRMRKTIRSFKKKKEELEQVGGKAISNADVFRALGLSAEAAIDVQVSLDIGFVSLDQPSQSDGDSGKELDFAGLIADDRIIHPSAVFDLEDDHEKLNECMEKLDTIPRMIIRLHFWNGMPLRPLGTYLGLTESRISQILGESIVRLSVLMKSK